MKRYFYSVLFFTTTLLFGAEIHEKVLICGVCRNVERRLAKTEGIMESIGALFDDYRILIYENNSIDRTPAMLTAWEKANPRVRVRSENLSAIQLASQFVNAYQDGTFFIPEQIARARNLVLDAALSPTYADFPYIIWMDMDFVRWPDLEGFIDTFRCSEAWDGVFAYGIDPDHLFWDWYALRDENYPIGSELLGDEWWQMKKELSFPKEGRWHPVTSAFGGCGIYKKEAIIGCRYSALVTPDLEEVAKQLLTSKEHPLIKRYWSSIEALEGISELAEPMPRSSSPPHANLGYLLHPHPDPVVWRMSSKVYRYPSVCEHVPFHASMIVRGHNKLFINPKLIFRYGD